MLLTKSHENRPASSGEDYLSVFYHIWGWQPSRSCDLDFAIKHSSLYSWMHHIKFHFHLPSGFSEEDL